jgi:hypothetical protein
MDEDTRRAWECSLTYGTPVELDEQAAPEVTIDLPGGLGWSGPLTLLRLGPASGGDEVPQPYRLALLPPEGRVPLAEIVVVPRTSTRGPGGGLRVAATDPSGLLSFEALFDGAGEDGRLRLRFSLAPWPELAGRPVQQVLPALRFATHWHAPNRLAVGPEHGPLLPGPAPALPDPPVLRRWMLRLAESLAAISDAAQVPVALPDMETVGEDDYRSAVAVGRVLAGEDVRLVADGLEILLPADEAAASGTGPRRARTVIHPVTVTLDGREHDVCDAQVELPPCRLVPVADSGPDGDGAVRMTVADSDGEAVMRLHRNPRT